MAEQRKVLIIDDERDIIRGVAVRLRSEGYEVLTATDGATGLGLAATALPDAILLDMRMLGMDGLGVLSGLKTCAETKAIPVIVASANMAEQVRDQTLAAGAKFFIGKPFQDMKLLSLLKDCVELSNVPSGHIQSSGGVA